MSDKKKKKQEENLITAGLMEQGDTLVDFFQANYVDKILPGLGKWKQGWAYFTEQRFICTTGILSDNIVVPYRNIRKIEKCSQFFFPIGIAITYKNMKNGEMVTSKVSMMKRDKWIRFMSEKAGI